LAETLFLLTAKRILFRAPSSFAIAFAFAFAFAFALALAGLRILQRRSLPFKAQTLSAALQPFLYWRARLRGPETADWVVWWLTAYSCICICSYLREESACPGA
jgi:hypothetical protein